VTLRAFRTQPVGDFEAEADVRLALNSYLFHALIVATRVGIDRRGLPSLQGFIDQLHNETDARYESAHEERDERAEAPRVS